MAGVVAYFAVGAVWAIPGVLGLIGLAAGAICVLRTLRYDPAYAVGPDTASAKRAEWIAILATVSALTLTPYRVGADTVGSLFPLSMSYPDGPVGYAVILTGTALIGSVALIAYTGRALGRHEPTTSVLAQLRIAYGSARRTHRAVVGAAAVLGVLAAVAGAIWGVPAAGLLGFTFVLAPARLLIADARRNADTINAIRGNLAGLFIESGAAAGNWSREQATAHRAPGVDVGFTGDVPTEIRIPLPVTAKADPTTNDALTLQIESRLMQWETDCEWSTTFAAENRRRYAVTRTTPPLPTIVHYDGRPADGKKFWLGTGKVSRELARQRPDLTAGETIDVHWDLAEIPHGLIVGGTGGGKSICQQLVLMQWLLAGHKLIILDPKRVGFTHWKSRRGVVGHATDVAGMAGLMTDARDEMMARFAVMEARGIDHIDQLPESERPPALLICLDEGTEALGQEKIDKDDEEGKAENASKAQIARALSAIVRLGRAASVHVIVGTQRPDVSQGIAGNTKAQLEGRLLLGAADQTARNMAGFSDTAVSAREGIKGRGIWGRVSTVPIELQTGYAPTALLDKYLPLGGAPVAPVLPPDASVADRVHNTEEIAQQLAVLRDAHDAGTLTDADCHAAGYGTVQAVETILNLLDQLRRADAIRDAKAVTVTAKAAATAESAPGTGNAVARPAGMSQALANLHALIGLGAVKDEMQKLVDGVLIDAERAGKGLKVTTSARHLVFVGPPGVGKTTVARLLGEIYCEIGLLTSGHVVEVDRALLVGDHQGATAARVDAAFEQAKGGVLIVDEAYLLNNGEGDTFGAEAIGALLKRAEDQRGDVVVILAGYEADMSKFLDANEGLRSRFTKVLRFAAYTDAELAEVFTSMAAGQDDVVDADAASTLPSIIRALPRGKSFGNARVMRDMLADAIDRRTARLLMIKNRTTADHSTLRVEDLRKADATDAEIDAALAELDGLVGLANVKRDVRSLVARLKANRARRELGLPTTSVGGHLVFTGPPGVGKTTIARCLARIYAALGVVSRGSFVECKAQDLVAGYVGQTPIKTAAVVQQALGGILFIDEVYTLLGNGPGNGFGQEAIDTLLPLMEDNRDDLVIIVAGYTEPTERFLDSNEGLRSRFDRTIEFADYTPSELLAVLDLRVNAMQLTLAHGARNAAGVRIETARTYPGWANARTVRKIFDAATTAQAERHAVDTNVDLTVLTAADFGGTDVVDVVPVEASVVTEQPEQPGTLSTAAELLAALAAGA